MSTDLSRQSLNARLGVGPSAQQPAPGGVGPTAQQPTPFLALGVTPKGEPYYGGGPNAFLRRAAAKIFDPNLYAAAPIAQVSLDRGQSATDYVIGKLPFLEDYRHLITAMLATGDVISQNPAQGIGLSGRALWFGVGGAAQEGLSLLARWVKKGNAWALGIRDVAEEYNVPILSPEGRRERREAPLPTSTRGEGASVQGESRRPFWVTHATANPDRETVHVKDFVNNATATGIFAIGRNLLTIAVGKAREALEGQSLDFTSTADIGRAIVSVGKALEFTAHERQLIDANVRASEMVYTEWTDDALRREAVTRILAGENPDFVVEELQNPWAELAGELVFDPLNMIDWLAPNRVRNILSGSADWLAKPVSPELTNALSDMARAAARGDDAVSGARSVQGIADAWRAGRQRFGGRALYELGETRGLTTLIASGKRTLVFQRVNTVLGWIGAACRKDPDEAAELVRALILAGSNNVDESNQAIMILMRSPLGTMMSSQGGMEASVVLGRLADELGGIEDASVMFRAADKPLAAIATGAKITDASTILRQIENHCGSAEELIKYLSPIVERSTASMFPDVDKMRDAARAVSAGRNVTPEIASLAARYQELSPMIRRLDAVNTFLRKHAGWDTMNRLFAGLYMHYSPGYALRNLFQDSLHLAVDDGLSTGIKSLGRGIEWIFKRNKKDLFSPGAAAYREIDDIAARGFGHLIDDLTAGKGLHAAEEASADAKKLFGFIPPVGKTGAEAFERIGSMTITHSTIVREFDNFLNVGLNTALDDVVSAGLQKSQADLLKRYIIENRGDVQRALELFRQDLSAGIIEAWRHQPVPERLAGFLGCSDNALLQTFIDARLNSRSRKEFVRAVAEIRSALINRAADVARQMPVNSTYDPEGLQLAVSLVQDVIEDSRGALTKADSERFQALINLLWDQRRSARSVATDASAGLVDVIARSGGDTNSLRTATKKLIISLDNAEREMVQQSRRFTDAIWEIDRAVRRGKTDFAKLTDNLPTMGGMTFVPGTYQDGREFMRDLFEFWNRANSAHYVNANVNYFSVIREDMIKMYTISGLDHARAVSMVDSQMGNVGRGIVESLALQNAPTVQHWTEALMRQEDVIRRMAKEFGYDRDILDVINGNLPDGAVPFEQLSDVPAQAALDAFRQLATKSGREAPADDVLNAIFERAGELGDESSDIARLSVRPVPTSDENMPTHARALYENLTGALEDLATEERRFLADWGRTEGGFSNPAIEKALRGFESEATRRTIEARAFIGQLAIERRNFALHAYTDKTYLDLATSFIYPYQYWYSRTYTKWLTRLAMEPQIIAAYAKYRRALERLHAGMPDYWKYQLSTNDLPGVESDNPMYFNLEATLNPINGLIGTDFNDPYRRATWYSRLVDDMGRFGPSTYTPISWVVAYLLHAQGEEEAAQRWGGRLVPQTALIKTLAYATNINIPGLSYNELDPFVRAFSGGLDPYERRRVGRTLGMMVEEGLASPEDALAASHSQEGELWNEAVNRAMDDRAPGQLASFMFGAGFKARRQSDVQIDQFYSEYFGLMQMRPNLSPDEFSDAMTELQVKYPWMDTVLVSRKAGQERDAAYAYSVLSRIPPGQMSEIAESVRITADMLDFFYSTKGTLRGKRETDWTDQDTRRFMAGIVDIGAMLRLPDNATRLEWNRARDSYRDMRDEMENMFGQDIQTQIDRYYELDGDARDAYMEQNPQVGAALDWQNQRIISTPIMYRYYGSLDTIQRYYTTQMYNTLAGEFGQDIREQVDAFDLARIDNPRLRTPGNLRAYFARKKELEENIERAVVNMASRLPDTAGTELQEGFVPSGPTQQDAVRQLNPELPSWQEWRQVLPDNWQRLIQEYFLEGKPLPSALRSQLDYMASDYGFESGSEMLRAIGTVIPR